MGFDIIWDLLSFVFILTAHGYVPECQDDNDAKANMEEKMEIMIRKGNPTHTLD